MTVQDALGLARERIQGTGARMTAPRVQVLAHRIAGPDRVWRFSVTGEAHETHAHFQCNRCGKVLCLDELSARKVPLRLPAGCRPERMELTVTGVCAECTI